MRRSRSRSDFFCDSLLPSVLLILAWHCSAASAPVLTAPQPFVIFDCAKDTIALRFVSATKPLAVITSDVQHVGASQAVGWTVAWRDPVAVHSAINEYEAIGSIGNRCPSIGKYHVTVNIVAAADGGGEPLVLSVERQTDASLYVTPTMATEVTKYTWWADSRRPRAGLLVREESQSNAINGLTLLSGELKASTGEFVGVRLGPSDAASITLAAGEQNEIPLQLSASAPAGVYSARLLVRSPDLVTPANVDMTLKVRVWIGYLLGILALGVTLGWLVNVRMAAAAALDQARLDALRLADSLVARAHAQRDPAVQQRMVRLAGELESRGRLCESSSALQGLITDTKATAANIEAAAEAALKTLLQDLASTRAEFGATPLDPALADCLRLSLAGLERIERVSEVGDVEEAARQLQVYRRGLPTVVRPALQRWLAAVNAALDALGTWTPVDREPEKTRAVLREGILAAYSLPDSAGMIQHANTIAALLRGWVALALPAATASIFHRAAGALRTGNHARAAASVDGTANDVLKITVTDPMAALNALAALRQRVDDLLLAESNAGDRPQVETLLDAGEFVSAAALVAPPPLRAQQIPMPSSALVPASLATTRPRRSSAPLPAASLHAVPLRIRLPSDMVVGQTVTASIDWAGARPPGVVVTWSCVPPDAATVSSEAHHVVTLIAKRAGILKVIAAIPSFPDLTAVVYAGSVLQTPDFKALEKRQRRLTYLTWTVTATLTTAVGVQVFAATWLGTPTDFFTAFVWGFFGQFGLDRIRDLVKPNASKTLQ